MTQRKYIGWFLVFIMLGLQLVLARHATVHFAETGYLSASSGSQSAPSPVPDKQDHDKICQVCLFEKHFSDTILSAKADITHAVPYTVDVAPAFDTLVARHEIHAYLSRGPPALLS